MRAEEFQERKVEVGGWMVNIASYRAGAEWHSKADNVASGAGLARASGATREEAEDRVLRRARHLLARTHRHSV
jgi:hypothetical protein